MVKSLAQAWKWEPSVAVPSFIAVLCLEKLNYNLTEVMPEEDSLLSSDKQLQVFVAHLQEAWKQQQLEFFICCPWFMVR